MSPRSVSFLCALLLAGSASVAVAQVPSAPPPQAETPPAPSDERVTKVDIPAGHRYLMERHKISAAEAAERIALEEEVTQLSNKLRLSDPDDFGDLWIEHEPVYRIVVAFLNNEDRSALRDQISPRLRRYVQFKQVKTSWKQREALIEQVVTALKPLGIDYYSHYDHRSDSIVIQTEADRAVQQIRQAIPNALQSFVTIRKGRVPRKMQATGARSGDFLHGGWWYYLSTAGGTYHECSFAFNAKDNIGRPVILSAGHCVAPTHIYYTDHWVSLAAPIQDRDYGQYDYQAQVITGLASGPWVYYENGKITAQGYQSYSSRNFVPGQPSSGYYKVVGTSGFYDQKVGQTLCKSGRATGLTCGKITHGWATVNGVAKWIESGDSAQYINAFEGDSGGAVFRSPTSTGNIIALGILSRGETDDPDGDPLTPDLACTTDSESAGYTGDCWIIHMPIDYIDDHQLLTLEIGTP
jgi:chromatin segregation and condensation protein Rec8/ScpA/Scc1 (kleisin family)